MIRRLLIVIGSLLIVIMLGIGCWLMVNRKEKKEIQKQVTSGFSKAIQEAEKQAIEKQKAEEEKKKKAEETKKFIATYGPCKNIPILMYHHIGAGPAWLSVKSEIFSQQLDYLIGKGYQVITLPEIVSALKGESQLPAKPMAITFDDGYRDFFDQAYPILRQKNLKATVFLITQLMDGSEYLTWEQVQQITTNNNLITVGDHTLDHRSMANMSDTDLINEITNSKRIIEEHLKIAVNNFAYPYGTVSNQAAKILAENGFVTAVKASSGLACAKLPYSLPRIRIGNLGLGSYGL